MFHTTPWGRFLSALVVPILLFATSAAFADERIADAQQPDLPGDGDFIKDASGSSGGDYLVGEKSRRGTGSGRGGDNVVVPEPGTIALIGLGLAGLGLAKRRRAKK